MKSGVWRAAVGALFLSSVAASAQDAAPITSVVLYPGSATLERTARVAQGAARVEIDGLPANFNPQTLRVEADAGIRIGEISHRDVGRAKAASAREAEIEDEIQALRDQESALDNDAQSAGLVREYLKNLVRGGATSEKPQPLVIDPKTVPAVIDAVSRADRDALARIQRVEIQKREINRRLQALERDRDRIRSGARDVRNITISLSASRAGSIRVSYQVNGAGWQPTYRAALDSIASKVELERQAIVSQRTGEDWHDVALKLSTGQPRRSPVGVDPRPWRLSGYAPERRSRSIAFEAAPAPAASMAKAPLAEADLADAAERRSEVVEMQGTFATEFEVPGRVTIPADGRKITVSLARQTIAVRQRVRVVPRLDPAAMITAVADRLPGVWPSGVMQLYRDASYIGSTRWNSQSSDRFELPFGRDDLVRVTVERRKDRTAEAGLMEKRIERTIGDAFTLTSQHKSPIDLLVLEPSPVAVTESIKVQTLFDPKPTTANWEERQGVVAWARPIGPGETVRLGVEYTISYPKELEVTGLP